MSACRGVLGEDGDEEAAEEKRDVLQMLQPFLGPPEASFPECLPESQPDPSSSHAAAEPGSQPRPSQGTEAAPAEAECSDESAVQSWLAGMPADVSILGLACGLVCKLAGSREAVISPAVSTPRLHLAAQLTGVIRDHVHVCFWHACVAHKKLLVSAFLGLGAHNAPPRRAVPAAEWLHGVQGHVARAQVSDMAALSFSCPQSYVQPGVPDVRC